MDAITKRDLPPSIAPTDLPPHHIFVESTVARTLLRASKPPQSFVDISRKEPNNHQPYSLAVIVLNSPESHQESLQFFEAENHLQSLARSGFDWH
jgi:hypothetical protein